MTRSIFILSVFLSMSAVLAAQEDSYYDLVENKGQWPSQVRYGCDVEQGKIFLEKDAFTFHFYDLSGIREIHASGKYPVAGEVRARGHVYRQQLIGSRAAVISGSGIQKSRFSYFLGNDESRWAGGCRAYASVLYSGLYPGIDLHYYVQDFTLKYDWLVAPGVSPEVIRWEYKGADQVFMEDDRLVVVTSVGQMTEQKPLAYQEIEGQRVLVDCRFRLDNGICTFDFPKGYDERYALVIDPVLIFSTYSGSFADNFGYTATYDSEGNLYSGSSAFGQGYPTTSGAYQTTWGGGDGGALPGTDIAISKYSSDGSVMLWSSFLGGSNDELPHSLICNANDEVLMYGTTSSPAFPVTAGAFDTVFNGGTAFAPQGVGTDYVNGSDMVVSRFSVDGSDLLSSTFIGGSANDGVNTSGVLKFNYADEFRGEIDLDDQGNVIIAGCTYSSNFPVSGAFQPLPGGGLDGCVVSLNPELTALNWSSFFGGSGHDVVNSVSFYSSGEMAVCGGTTSQNLSNTSGNYNASFNGGTSDGWIGRISASGNQLLDATYFGGQEYDQLYFVEVDGDDHVNVFGQTLTNGNALLINAGWGVANSGMLVAKFSADLSQLTWSTVFGTGNDKANLSPAAFTVDVCGKIYLSGWGGVTNTSTNSNAGSTTGLPVTADAQQLTTDGSDFYMLVMESDASELVYASFFGGGVSMEHVDGGTSRFDRRGVIYQSVCAGCGSHDDFPIFPPGNVVSATNNSSNCNNGVFKFDFQLPFTVADFTVPPVVCIGQPTLVDNLSQYGQSFNWDFGGLFTSTGFEPSYTFGEPGEYVIRLTAMNPNTCNMEDVVERTIMVIEPQSGTLDDLRACNGESVVIGPDNSPVGAQYEWQPADYLSDPADPNPVFSPGASTEYVLLIRYGVCTDTLRQQIHVSSIDLSVSEDMVLCEPEEIVLNALADAEGAHYTWSLQADLSAPLLSGEGQTELSYAVSTPVIIYVGAEINGCLATEEIAIDMVSFQTIIQGDFTACEGDTVTLFVLNPNPVFVYEWSPESALVSGQGEALVEVQVDETTTFHVESITPFGCSAEDEVLVTVSGLQTDDIDATVSANTVLAGQSVTLTANPEGYAYSWTPVGGVNTPTGRVTEATVWGTTTYYVQVSDGECVARDSVRVVVLEFVCGPPFIYVPNAFTPNKDGNNERLFVRANHIDDLIFRIYDRWGELVFETTDSDRGWDGTYKEVPVDPAVFVYYLEATCAGGETYIEKGNITVIR